MRNLLRHNNRQLKEKKGMDARTTIVFEEGDVKIEGVFFAERPKDFYVVKVGNEDSIVSCGFSCRDSEEVPDALLHLLHDIEAILKSLIPCVIENSGKPNINVSRFIPTIKCLK